MTPGSIERDHITGLVLAGGQGRRMGGIDKGLLSFHGRALIACALERLRPQVATVLINANRRQDEYAALQSQVIADDPPGYLGPLAGIASGMGAAATPYLVTVPCDSPWLPDDYVARLIAAGRGQDAEIVVAYGAGRLQPVFALLPCSLRPALLAALTAGERKVEHWFKSRRLLSADFSDRPEMFININTPEDLSQTLQERVPP